MINKKQPEKIRLSF